MSPCELCGREIHGEPAAYMCPGCTRRLVEDLDALGPLYASLGDFLEPGARPAGYGPVRAAEAPLPVAEGPLNLLGPGGVVHVLEEWRSALWADLGFGQPRIHGTYADRLKRAVGGIRVNSLWIAERWPAAGDLAREVGDLVKAVGSIVDPPERSVRVGTCPTLLDDGEPCGAVLRYLPGAATIRCTWCRSEHGPSDWVALATALEAGDAA